MKSFFSFLLLLAFTQTIIAETPSLTPKTENGWNWYDTADWQPGGQAWTDGIGHYMRIPDRAVQSLPPGYRKYANNTAGLYFLFQTNAETIRLRIRLASENLAMEHMPATGVSGFDLYARDPSGKWIWAGINYPAAQAETTDLVTGLSGIMTSYKLLLPLYNGVESLEIGVPATAEFRAQNPDTRKPIFQYGSSIDHGGCASRPGNSYSAVMSRRLDYPFINFGFSGSAMLEPEVAQLISETDPAIFLIATLNAPSNIVAERGIPFIEIIREKHPETPIVVIGNYSVSNSWARPAAAAEQRAKSDEIDKLCNYFIKKGDRNFYQVDTADFCGEGTDCDGTVDGLHPNDLGMRRYADRVEPLLREILHQK